MHPLIKLLTVAILTLALLSAGCTDTGGSSANSPAAVATATQATTAEPTVEATENWWDGKPGFHDAKVGTYSTLLGDIDGVKTSSLDGLVYDLYDTETGQHILGHQDFTSFDPYDDLQPEQARALETQYGYPESVVMEQADTDGDGALDKVAVRYEGSKGSWTEEFNYFKAASLKSYLQAHIDPTIYPELIIK